MSKRKKSSDKRVPRDQSPRSLSSGISLGVPAGIALIAVLACIAYLPSINGGFILDDDRLLTDNNLIKTDDGLYRFWCSAEPIDYWPGTSTTLWIEWRLWEMNPVGYHVTNLLLHVVEALLIWLILRKLSIPGAFLAAMLFAVHPVNVESVAWITQRKNVMAMLFFLLSILWYLKAARSHAGAWERGNTPWADPQRRRHTPCADPAHGVCGLHTSNWYWLSLAAFVLAMLSKGSAAILPVMLLGIIWWRRGSVIKWDLVGMAPFFVATIGFTMVNIWFQTHGSGEVLRSADFIERLLGAGGVVWFYLYKALLPFDLAFVYPQWHIQAGNPLWWLPLCAAMAITAVLWWYRKSWSRPLLFAWGFFCVALAPVMGFTDVGFMKYSLVADHYLHIAIIGMIALVSAGFSVWRQRAQGIMHHAATVGAIVAVASLALLTWLQNGIYRDAITLYQAALEKNPGFLMGQSNLGAALYLKGQFEEAIEHYEQAIRIKPDYPAAHNNLAIALVQIGRYQDAIMQFEQALRFQADYPMAEYNLGIALGKVGRLPEAIKHYEKAIRLKPDYTAVYYNLATSYAKMNKSSEAIAAAQKGLEFAQSQGLSAKAKQFEDWLRSYRAKPSEHSGASPAGKSVPPSN